MMEANELQEILEKHKLWLKHEKGGIRADLSGADLDYSCLPLWCGSLTAKFDDRQIIQIVYHAVKAGLQSPNVSDEVKRELAKVSGLANRFHRVNECGAIGNTQEGE